jgi:hypothetical protein
MNDFLKLIFVAALVLAVLAIAPALFLWAVNSLAEAGGADFYIQHSFWNYLVSLVLLVLLNSGGSR